MINGDALTATGTNLSTGSLTNLGLIHASLTGTALTGAHVAGLSNVVNVGSIQNNAASSIIGDYEISVSFTSLSGPNNTFKIDGVNNESAGSITSFSNYGTILGTIDSGIDTDTVARGIIVGLNNDGSIGTLNNSSLISADLGDGVSRQSNNFSIVGLANSNWIGALTNSGAIYGDEVGIVNGNVLLSGPSSQLDNSATISQLANSGTIIGGSAAIANYGHMDTITNTGLIQAYGYAAIVTAPKSSIGLIDNQTGASIIGNGYAALVNTGTISTLTNEGFIGSGGEGGFAIVNEAGTIGTLSNSGTISANVSGVSNLGGTINSLTNSGLISGGGNGLENVYGTIVDSTISSAGTINTLVNSGGVISGNGNDGILNSGLIGSLTNTDSGTVVGSILGGNYGITNEGQITSLTNAGVIQGYYDGINNASGTIGTLVNAQGGTIMAQYTGIYNSGQIGSLTNNGTIYGESNKGISNVAPGSITTLINSGAIAGGVTGIWNNGMIGSINNSGSIVGLNNGSGYGIINNPTGGEGGPAIIEAITNSGYIAGYSIGIDNTGSIGTLVNLQSGLIIAVTTAIYNSGHIGSLANSGLIGGEGRFGIGNDVGGTIGTLTNSGTIAGGDTGLNNAGVITALTNSGTITGRSTDGIRNSGVVNALTNSGLIEGQGDNGSGVDNVGSGSIGTLTNLSGGKIMGGESGIYNENTAVIGRLTNAGLIVGGTTGIDNEGSIGTLSNTGLITGAAFGVLNDGMINSLNNNGTISGTTIIGTLSSYYGIFNTNLIKSLTNNRLGTISGNTAIENTGSIGTLTNAGAVLGVVFALRNDGTIGTLNNSGNILGAEADGAVVNDYTAAIGSLVNSGVISSRGTGLDNYGTIASLVNSGKITGVTEAGIYNSGSVTSLDNRGGLISGVYGGLYNDSEGTIGALTNSGTIEATGKMADGVYNAGWIADLTNSGLIQGTRSGVYNANAAMLDVLTNYEPLSKGAPTLITVLTNSSTGTISGAKTGIYNESLIGAVINSGVISGPIGLNNDAAGSIVALLNAGTVMGRYVGLINSGLLGSLTDTGTVTGGNVGLMNSGLLGSLTNTGTIKGDSETGIENSGAIGTLANSGLISAPTAINVAEGGSLGLLTNSGKVAGNIVNASTNDLSIAGGSGTVFGTLTGYAGGLGVSDIGQITNTKSNVAFTSGNLLLNDHVDVGTGTVSNASTLQVDNAIDIKGNYLQTSAGTLSLGVASLSEHGELDVSSAAAVNADGHVALTRLDGFRFAAGERFTLIEAGSATYNVANLSALAAGFSGGYLINDVQSGGKSDLVVCLTNLVKANCDGGIAYSNATTSNAIIANNAVGGYTGSNVALNKLADAVAALGTSPAANRAGNQLSADPHNNGAALATQPSLDVLNVVTGHADIARLAANGGESGVSAGEPGPGLATWGEAFGGGSHQSEDGQFSGYSMSSEGVVAGGDAAVADSNVRVGGVFTYTHADLQEHGDRTGDTMSLDSYGVLGYGNFIGEHAYLDLLGGVLFDKFDTVRVVSFTNFSGVATGSHDGTQYVAKAAGGYRLPMGGSGTTLTPIWGLTYSHLHQDGYTESGGNGAALTVDSESDNSLKGEVGLKLEHTFAMAHGDVVPDVRAMYRHEFDSGAQVQTASFAADENASFTTLDARAIENSGMFSAGVNFLGRDGVTVTLRYTAEAATGYVSQGGSLRVRWSF
jgi:outer membrane autotransporter protein